LTIRVPPGGMRKQPRTSDGTLWFERVLGVSLLFVVVCWVLVVVAIALAVILT
jgi:hypothetical protein